jgi:glyoxylase-like metal-dependent hydrolase (beta-lactamase superfamily II)
MNRRFRLAVNGDPSLDWRFTRMAPNASLDEFVAAAGALTPAPTVTTDELSLNEVAEGVFLVGGNGTYVLFVENEDYVVAVDGTAGVPDRIAELRKHVGDKPIRYAALTHHHNDHVLGVPTYVEEGATLVVARAHEGVMRQAAGEGADPKFEYVDGSRTLGEGAGRVELIDLGPTPHAEHILAAWLPEQGILFHADMINTPLAGPLPPPVSNTKALAEVIAKRKLAVKSIVGAHSPQVLTLADLGSDPTK